MNACTVSSLVNKLTTEVGEDMLGTMVSWHIPSPKDCVAVSVNDTVPGACCSATIIVYSTKYVEIRGGD